MDIYVFAGPNGSGKSTIFKKFISINSLKSLDFINADNIAVKYFSDIGNLDKRNLFAAQYAEKLREQYLLEKKSFMFETVLSTDRNLKYLQKAKQQGANIRVIYVLTRDENINIERVKNRVSEGGHDVPEDKIKKRYKKCLELLPEVIDVSDSALIYDNSLKPLLIVSKKSKNISIFSPNKISDDKWLTETIIKPLQERNYVIKVKENFIIETPFNFEEIQSLKINNKINNDENLI